MPLYQPGDKVVCTKKGSEYFGAKGVIRKKYGSRSYVLDYYNVGGQKLVSGIVHDKYELAPDGEQPIDPYAELKKAYAEGKQIQFKNAFGGWSLCLSEPFWSISPDCYRVKPEEEKVDPYAELKKAKAEGKTIQAWRETSQCWIGRWQDVDDPSWCQKPYEYRIIKPKEKKVDPYAELKKAHAEGKQIEYFSESCQEWSRVSVPIWYKPPEQYRVKPEDGGIKVGHLDVIAAKAGVGKSFVMNVTKPTNKEMKMKFETKNYLNGQDVTNLDNIEIYREIAREEAALKALSEVTNKPKRLVAEIESRTAELKRFVAFLDSQDKGA